MILGSLTLLDLIVLIIALVILWIIVSIPAYIAGKIVTSGRSTFGEAMLATLLGPIVYIITLGIVDFLLGSIIGTGAYIWALIFAFIAWVGVYKVSFRTGWLAGLAIAILAIIVFAVMSIIIGFLFGLTIPTRFFPQL